MRRCIAALMVAVMLASGSVASAGQWGYGGGYPPPVQQDRPILKAVVIGGALIGLGFALGRVTAPKPNFGPAYGYPPAGYGPAYGYQGSHGHGQHGRRF